jgi:hypothetical protein
MPHVEVVYREDVGNLENEKSRIIQALIILSVAISQ